MANIIELNEEKLPDSAYIFKHSTRCPISTSAANAVKASDLDPIYWINVVEQRELSDWFAETYKVVHQSPQLIKIENGKAEQDWSHSAINAFVSGK